MFFFFYFFSFPLLHNHILLILLIISHTFFPTTFSSVLIISSQFFQRMPLLSFIKTVISLPFSFFSPILLVLTCLFFRVVSSHYSGLYICRLTNIFSQSSLKLFKEVRNWSQKEGIGRFTSTGFMKSNVMLLSS